ncbi:DUF2929 family protein [Aquibacillus kalidii]|uniref:DUF2929 family protein n=1 Tax=Aquibacillus kalidii TaxID=2762597 RepID=UPI002E2B458F|nr:DUF2929 family protein [Aquibacillus kalidii]
MLRYIWTIIWSILLSFLAAYVLTSMAGETLSLTPVFVIAAFFAVAVIIIGDGILTDDEK